MCSSGCPSEPSEMLRLLRIGALAAQKAKPQLLNKHGKGFHSQAEPQRKIIKKSFPPNGCFKKTFPSPTYSTLHNSSLFMKMKSPRSLRSSPYGGGCDIWRNREENMVLLICLSAPGTGPLAGPLHTVPPELRAGAAERQ